jgi:uncharacterized protein YbjT (DUF2867 family)
MGKRANIIGATGLVGRELTRQLLADERYERVRSFVRRASGNEHPRLEEHVVDFDQGASWHSDLAGDELYSAMGTTIKQAGSKAAQVRIDYTYPLAAATAAAANGVGRLLLVSASGANARSRIFYSRIKGELDHAVSQLPFAQVAIFRPSLLLGERAQPRRGERVGEVLLKAAAWIPGVAKYRAIPGATVAAAMVAVANAPIADRVTIATLDELFALAAPGGLA